MEGRADQSLAGLAGRRAVHAGRRKFLAQFPSLATGEMQARLPDPADPATFLRCKLDQRERERHVGTVALHRDLLRLRRDDGVLGSQRPGAVRATALGASALVVRFRGDEAADRLLLVNLGPDLVLRVVPVPDLAPPSGRRWALVWSSEDPRYGGGGHGPIESDRGWLLPGRAAVALAAERVPGP